MVFNSLSFIIFFSIVFFVYNIPLAEKTTKQNWLLFLASYFFYAYADLRLIPLLFFVTLVFYFLGIKLENSKKKKGKLIATLGIVLGLGLLLYFKYLNFLIESFTQLFNSIGLETNWDTFKIIMPLGISFFTFRLISYIIEIYRGKIKATKDFVVFATYVSFFPTIMSGPIDRPNSFIPQLEKKRGFNADLIINGCRQILWGMFQKTVIADNLSPIINTVWEDIPNHRGSTLLFVAILYCVQLYTDFSGYSHIAIGISKLLGFRISKNFDYPFFARNISEFWRKWHISLTSWFTDYIFMPLNIKFRDFGNFGVFLAILINLLFVAVWHGANSTFLVFGLYNGLLFVPVIFSATFYKNRKQKLIKYGLPSIIDFFKISFTFLLVAFGIILFRANDLNQALEFISGIFNKSVFSKPYDGIGRYKVTLLFMMIFFILEWFSSKSEFPFSELHVNRFWRYLLYYTIIFIIMCFGNFGTNQFIYFKF
ncbi:MAG: MBOAT family protein [Flavobacteriales bacterium]|nr:MBOAT family protein [Flavobacteriales bacterium]